MVKTEERQLLDYEKRKDKILKITKGLQLQQMRNILKEMEHAIEIREKIMKT